MPRTTYSAIVIVILAMGMLSSNAQAAAKFSSELSQVEITLPGDRWTLTRSKENPDREWVRAFFKDSLRVANVFWMERLRRYQRKYITIDEWFEEKIVPRTLERYATDGDYSIESQKWGEATLGSGQLVTTVKYSLIIIVNGEFRNVRFAYFPNQDGSRWSYVFVSNYGADRDQEDAFKKIMKGITLRE